MYAFCNAWKAFDETFVSICPGPIQKAQLTGVRSEFFKPRTGGVLESLAGDWRPSISTMMTSFTPVFVSQPYMARRSSMAWRRPKSWPTFFSGRRASKISRQVESMKEKSSLLRSSLSPSAGNIEMWRGLFFWIVRIKGGRCEHGSHRFTTEMEFNVLVYQSRLHRQLQGS